MKWLRDTTPFFIFVFGLIIVWVTHCALKQTGIDFPASSYVVFFLGALAAYIELSSRYPDSPESLLFIGATQLYLTLNALLCYFAFVCLKTFDLGPTITDPAVPKHAQYMLDVITAVFSTQLIFRSSLFVLKDDSNNNSKSGGLAGFITGLLDLIDSHVDRHRARKRSEDIHKIIGTVSAFDLTHIVLPYLEQLLQNSDAKAFAVGERIAKIYQANDASLLSEVKAVFGEVSPHTEKIKPVLIALELYSLVGKSTLIVAITQLRNNDLFVQASPGQDSDDNQELAQILSTFAKKKD
ncbi:hypothetical protein [Pseudoalteromonas sp. OOF1S-7]|uniref:hypothetical protein n=1 Tax=Pseudoalteromonas sp. OOF1S-7 TaxID=2917757 RepID=UPI001EF68800|nr:hypothetical protein [Pseudoalteromonas sp. OOF1S-7]MCG7536627.1 hypothetical protein [Pseudoalteromonas sp. OOF1S-7]